MVLSWMVRVTMVMMRITVTMVTGLTTGMMRPTMKTMGMINTIKTTSLGFLLITSLEHHWSNRQQIHRHIILRPQYHCCKQDDKHNTLTPLINSTRGSSHTNQGVHIIRHSHPLSTHLLLITTPCWQTLQQRYYSSIHPQTPYQLKCELSSQMNYEFWMILTDCQYRAVS